MKIRRVFTIMLVLAGILKTVHAQDMEKSQVMIEDRSRFGFAETVGQLSSLIVERGWRITATHDLQATLKKNGKEVLPVSVIELCNPEHAHQILSKDEFRDVSPMLPCRISVYEKQDGNTYISRMNAPAFAVMIGGEAGKTMITAFNETEEILGDVILK